MIDTVFVTETQKPLRLSNLKVRPNPAKDMLQIELPDGSGSLLEMTDLQGRNIQRIPVTDPQNISLKGLRPGIYMLKVEGYRVGRLVVKP